MHDYANDIDEDPVSDVREEAKGYSAETTVEEDLIDLEKQITPAEITRIH